MCMKDNCIYKIIEYSINKYEITDSIDGLKYPYKEFNWKTAFVSDVKNAKYDENDHYVEAYMLSG